MGGVLCTMSENVFGNVLKTTLPLHTAHTEAKLSRAGTLVVMSAWYVHVFYIRHLVHSSSTLLL